MSAAKPKIPATTALSTSARRQRPLAQMGKLPGTRHRTVISAMTQGDHQVVLVRGAKCVLSATGSARACVRAEATLRIVPEVRPNPRNTAISMMPPVMLTGDSMPDYVELPEPVEDQGPSASEDVDFPESRQSSCHPELATATCWVYLRYLKYA
jgi:hypothetical protein